MKQTVKKEDFISKSLSKKAEDMQVRINLSYNYKKAYIPEDMKGQFGAMAYALKAMYDAITFSKKAPCSGYWGNCIGYLWYGNRFLKLLKKHCRGVV